MAYSFVISKSTGEDVGEILTASKRQIVRTLNAPTTATVSIPLADPLATFLLPGANPRIKVYRSPTAAELAASPGLLRTLLLYGSLPQPNVALDADGDTITATFADPRWVLDRRYALGTETYTATDQGLVAWGLVDTQNLRSGGDTWIRQGTVTTGTLRDRAFSRQVVSQLLADLCNVVGGPDIDLLPVDYYASAGTRAMGDLWVYSRQGNIKPNAVFGYGPNTISNIAGATLTYRDVTTLATVTGNTSNSVPVISTAGTPDAANFGLLEAFLADPDVSIQATADAKAQGIISEQGQLRPVIGLKGVLPDGPQAFSAYDVGDTVTAAINRGAFVYNGQLRVMQFTLDVGQAGELATQLVVA